MGQNLPIPLDPVLTGRTSRGRQPVTLTDAGPVYGDARTMRIVLDELWEALGEPDLFDRNFLISILAGRDARTAARIAQDSPQPF